MYDYILPAEAKKYFDESSLKSFAQELLSTDEGKRQFIELLEDACKNAPNGKDCLQYLSLIDKRLFDRFVLHAMLKQIDFFHEEIYLDYQTYKKNDPHCKINKFYDLHNTGHINSLGISRSTFYRMIKKREKIGATYIPYEQLTRDIDETTCFFLGFVANFCCGTLCEYLSSLFWNVTYLYLDFHNSKSHSSRRPFNDLPAIFQMADLSTISYIFANYIWRKGY